MESENWRRVKEIFLAALELEPARREEFLDKSCGGDDSLRREVDSLLQSHHSAQDFIEKPVIVSTSELLAESPPVVSGQRIGVYQVVREIGRGGMGAVFLAVRADDQFRKQVAIKLIKRGMDTDFVIRRFRYERQMLANLDHPNIARLIDGGATDDGLPYFVMDYVAGVSIDEYCDTRRLPVVERLKLFQQVCSAVHYAHQNLIVHRDIKPSNVLVTADGVPKLLDFGVAKLLGPDPASRTFELTGVGVKLMTPDYASPEQVQGQNVTVATDVYSLGVLLYELLTGRRPHRFESYSPQEIERVLAEEPARPSAAILPNATMPASRDTLRSTPEAAAEDRGTQPSRLRKRLAGDLDNIALMALRREPTRRYSSVQQLSDDVDRHLKGLPVIARPDTLAYRASKFMKRHRTAAAAAALVVVALVAGLAATLWQAHIAQRERQKAERRFNDVRRLANSFLFEFHDAVQYLPGSTSVRELLVSRALEYLDSLAREAGGDRGLQQELAAAYQKVGDVQGNPYMANLGDISGALASYRKSLAIRQEIFRLNSSDLATRRDLASSYDRMRDVLRAMGDIKDSLENDKKALELREALALQQPSDGQAQRELAGSLETLADDLAAGGDLQAALGHHRKALEMRQALLAKSPADVELRRDVAISFSKLGTTLGLTGNAHEALKNYHKSLEIRAALSGADPTNARLRRELSAAYVNLGDMHWASDQLKPALENYRKGLAHREALAAADPQNVQAQRDLAIVHGSIGSTLAYLGNMAAARASVRHSVEMFERLAEQNSKSKAARRDLSLAYVTAGDVHAVGRNPAAVAENYRSAIAISEPLAREDSANAMFQRDLATLYSGLADALTSLGSDEKTARAQRAARWREARGWYVKSLQLWSGKLLGQSSQGKSQQMETAIGRCDAELRRFG